jgi:hypothetical protein
MLRAHPAMQAFLHRPWLMPKRVNTRAKAKTIARAKAVARPATLVAKARTLAKAREAARLTEANHLKHSDETAVVRNGPEFSNSGLRISARNSRR